jgi:hypothetical protein
VERKGKARRREATAVTVEAIDMGMVRRCRGGGFCFTSAASSRSSGWSSGCGHTEHRQEQRGGWRSGRWTCDELMGY